MSDKQTTDLATIETYDQFVEALGAMATDDPEAAARAIVERIINAETVDAVFAGATGLAHASDHLRVPLTIHEARAAKSDFEEGLGGYLILTVTNRDGEKLQLSCGGSNVVAQVWRLAKLKAFPIEVFFDEADQTAAGYRPLWLHPVTPDTKVTDDGRVSDAF